MQQGIVQVLKFHVDKISIQSHTLHSQLSTNDFLEKIGLVDSNNCTFCQAEEEKIHDFGDAWHLVASGITLNVGGNLVKLSCLLLLWVWSWTLF